MTNILRINSLDFRGSTCDGPGIRTVVFLQGCKQHCLGCHNRSTWAINAGQQVNIATLIKIIEARTPSHKVTISGGEPLLQLEGLFVLVRELHQRDFSLVLYTGKNIEDIPCSLLVYLDYIKVGVFKQELQTSVHPYIGSTNQEFIKLH